MPMPRGCGNEIAPRFHLARLCRLNEALSDKLKVTPAYCLLLIALSYQTRSQMNAENNEVDIRHNGPYHRHGHRK